jgi:hypothetical protein
MNSLSLCHEFPEELLLLILSFLPLSVRIRLLKFKYPEKSLLEWLSNLPRTETNLKRMCSCIHLIQPGDYPFRYGFKYTDLLDNQQLVETKNKKLEIDIQTFQKMGLHDRKKNRKGKLQTWNRREALSYTQWFEDRKKHIASIDHYHTMMDAILVYFKKYTKRYSSGFTQEKIEEIEQTMFQVYKHLLIPPRPSFSSLPASVV